MATAQFGVEPEEIFFRVAFAATATMAATFVAWVQLTPPRVDDLTVAVERGSILVMKLPRIELPDPVKVVEIPRLTPSASRPVRRPAARTADTTKPAGSLEIQRVGHLGKDTSGLVATLFDRDTARLDEALRGVKNTDHASRDAGGLKRVEHADEDRFLALGQIDAGPTRTIARDLHIAPMEKEVVIDAVETDTAMIRAVLRKHEGRMMTCYEQSAKQDASLSGRVELGWTIAAGKVQDVTVVKNSSNNAELGACMLRAMRAVRFPADVNAEVAVFPWVFSGG